MPASAVAARGAPIPGATYTGAGTDGAAVTLTVSSDGTLITAYQITGVAGDTCEINDQAFTGGWPGAPIQNDAFDYRYTNIVVLKGSFTGPQTASGTFYLHNDGSAATKPCSSPTVSWTATTTSKPVKAPPPGKPTVATRVSLRRASKHRVKGQLSASDPACLPGRTVTLWRGSRKLSATHTGASGKYSFAVSKKLRGRMVRTSVSARTVTNAICAAGSSTFIHA
jgi:hypothetical protein